MNKKILVALLIFFAIGIFLRLNLTEHVYGWDESIYLQHAEIFGGFKQDNYNEMNFRPIFMSLIFAGAFKIWHSPLAANLIISIFGAFSILIAYKIGEKVFNQKVGFIAAFIVAISSSHVALSREVLMHVPALFFTLCFFYLIKLGEEKDKFWYFGFAAFCAGLAVLTRFTYLMVLPLFIINFLLYRKKYNLKKLVLMAVVFSSTLAPYLYWNYLNFNDFLHTFKYASLVVNWNTVQPFSMYLANIPAILGGIGIIGMILWIAAKIKTKKVSREEIVFLAWAILFIVSTFHVPQKETRYIFGSLGGFFFLAAVGLEFFFNEIRKRKKIVFPLTILLVLGFAGASAFIQHELTTPDFSNLYLPETAEFLEKQDLEIVYTHGAFTQLAYYTNKTIVLASFNKTRFFDVEDNYMNQPGHYVYVEKQTKTGLPSREEISEDNRFELVFEKGETIVYRFKPSFETLSGKYITISFDDAYESQFEAIKILNEKNMSAVLYVIAGKTDSYFDGIPTMSKEKVSELSRTGNEIGGHTFSHPHLLEIGLEEFEEELEKSRNFFDELDISVVSFAYPYGEINYQERIEQEFEVTRGVGWQDYRVPLNSRLVDGVPITRNNFENSLKLIQNLKESRWLIILIHDVSDNPREDVDITWQDFDKIIQEIESSGAEVITFRDALRLNLIRK